MRIKLFTLRYSSTLGGFDEGPIREFMRDKEVLQFREHFFVLFDVPHLACVLTYQEPVLDEETRVAAGQLAAEQNASGRREPWRGSGPPGNLSEPDRAIWASLREWRSEAARSDGVPPYLVLTNRELTAIVLRRPESLNALGSIRGVGTEKVKRYGKAILELLRGSGAEGSSPTQAESQNNPPTDGRVA